MQVMRLKVAVPALAVCAALLSAGAASALPLSPATGGADLVRSFEEVDGNRIEVRNRGAGIAAGVIGGLILGGIIASQRPYYYDRPYYYRSYPYPAYRSYPAGDGAIAYCMRRFRSYDPYSMTYLGYDGFRHPCP
jgi:hypothetical protein